MSIPLILYKKFIFGSEMVKKIAQKNIDFWLILIGQNEDQQQHPVGHTGEVGRESVCVHDTNVPKFHEDFSNDSHKYISSNEEVQTVAVA